jgi:hypothetical protein
MTRDIFDPKLSSHDRTEEIRLRLLSGAGQGGFALGELISLICQRISTLETNANRLLANIEVLDAIKRLRADLDVDFSSPMNENSPILYPSRISADMLIDAADGFYPLEWTPNGLPYRWTGPKREFRFAFRVNRSLDASFQLTCIAVHGGVGPESVTARVDGRFVQTSVRHVPEGFQILGPIEKKPSSRSVEIVFEMPTMSIASESDSRLIGLAFTALDTHHLDVGVAHEQ